ncbi:unnamed protein product [Heligmosomoides polygyrus]|uniref:Integrase catalytic domain-containing protein n=1 Tax=Heligmosomoides polygyrus TaxID=6339 RepID=A0A3P8B776_HELPZ|nr:unnamed protein product [Heligmosomoides polygyrus]
MDTAHSGPWIANYEEVRAATVEGRRSYEAMNGREEEGGRVRAALGEGDQETQYYDQRNGRDPGTVKAYALKRDPGQVTQYHETWSEEVEGGWMALLQRERMQKTQIYEPWNGREAEGGRANTLQRDRRQDTQCYEPRIGREAEGGRANTIQGDPRQGTQIYEPWITKEAEGGQLQINETQGRKHNCMRLGMEEKRREGGRTHCIENATIPFSTRETEAILDGYINNYGVYHHAMLGGSRNGITETEQKQPERPRRTPPKSPTTLPEMSRVSSAALMKGEMENTALRREALKRKIILLDFQIEYWAKKAKL